MFNFFKRKQEKPTADAEQLHREARALGQAGKYDAAIEKLRAAIAAKPDWAYPYYDLAFTYFLKGDAELALTYYRQVGAGEHYLPAQIRSAAVLAQQGKLDEARSQLSAAAARDPQMRVQLLIAEAALLRQAEQSAAALALLEHELGEQADQPELLYESALLAERLGRLEVMEKRLRKLIELQPQSA